MCCYEDLLIPSSPYSVSCKLQPLETSNGGIQPYGTARGETWVQVRVFPLMSSFLAFFSRLANVDSHSGNPIKTFPFSMLCLL